MAYMPMGPTTEYQESMFDETTTFAPADEGEPELESIEPFDESPEPSEEASSEEFAPVRQEPEAQPETEASTQEPVEPQAQSVTMLTVDDFTALEDRVVRAVSLVRRERQARTAAEERVAALAAELQEAQAKSSAIEQLQQEVQALRTEREQVRQRVERLLSQLDSLEL